MNRSGANFLLSISSLLAATSATRRMGRLQLLLLRCAGVRTAGPVLVGRGVDIQIPGNLTLGQRVSLGPYSRLSCWEQVSIGDDFMSATGLLIDSGAHDPETLSPSNRPIKIGDRVWCGVRVTICAGVTIGDDVVVGAGAVVVRSIPAGTVVAGVPARPIRALNRKSGGPPPWSYWAD